MNIKLNFDFYMPCLPSKLCFTNKYLIPLKMLEAGETSENLLFLNLGFSSKQNTDRNNIITGSKPGEKKVFNLPQFSFSSISAATDNFSPANKLGEGGFGPVYKVMHVQQAFNYKFSWLKLLFLLRRTISLNRRIGP